MLNKGWAAPCFLFFSGASLHYCVWRNPVIEPMVKIPLFTYMAYVIYYIIILFV